MKYIRYILLAMMLFAGNVYASWTTENSPGAIMGVGIATEAFAAEGLAGHVLTLQSDNSITFEKNGFTYKITPEIAQRILSGIAQNVEKFLILKPENNEDPENRVVIRFGKFRGTLKIEETGSYFRVDQAPLIRTLTKDTLEGKDRYKYVVKYTCGEIPIEAKIDEVAACQFYLLRFLAFNNQQTGLTTNILAQDAAGKKYKMTVKIEGSYPNFRLSVVSAAPADAPTSGFIISALDDSQDPYKSA